MVSKIQGFFYYQKIRTGSMGHRIGLFTNIAK